MEIPMKSLPGETEKRVAATFILGSSTKARMKKHPYVNWSAFVRGHIIEALAVLEGKNDKKIGKKK